MNEIKTIGFDLAKTVFHAHGVDHQGKAVLKKKLTRKEVLPFSLEIFLNAIDWMALNWAGNDPFGWMQMKQQTEDKFKQALNGTLPAVQIQDFSTQNPVAGPHAYTGKIYVLINRNTASSGESTTNYLGALPFAKVVGENSAGAIHFGTMGLIELPNSKIVMSNGH